MIWKCNVEFVAYSSFFFNDILTSLVQFTLLINDKINILTYCSCSGRASYEDDVYNFGFILLESLVGPIASGQCEMFFQTEKVYRKPKEFFVSLNMSNFWAINSMHSFLFIFFNLHHHSFQFVLHLSPCLQYWFVLEYWLVCVTNRHLSEVKMVEEKLWTP